MCCCCCCCWVAAIFLHLLSHASWKGLESTLRNSALKNLYFQRVTRTSLKAFFWSTSHRTPNTMACIWKSILHFYQTSRDTALISTLPVCNCSWVNEWLRLWVIVFQPGVASKHVGTNSQPHAAESNVFTVRYTSPLVYFLMIAWLSASILMYYFDTGNKEAFQNSNGRFSWLRRTSFSLWTLLCCS